MAAYGGHYLVYIDLHAGVNEKGVALIRGMCQNIKKISVFVMAAYEVRYVVKKDKHGGNIIKGLTQICYRVVFAVPASIVLLLTNESPKERQDLKP